MNVHTGVVQCVHLFKFTVLSVIISYLFNIYCFIVSKNGVSNTLNKQDRDINIESGAVENHNDKVVSNNTTSLCDMTNLVSFTFKI